MAKRQTPNLFRNVIGKNLFSRKSPRCFKTYKSHAFFGRDTISPIESEVSNIFIPNDFPIRSEEPVIDTKPSIQVLYLFDPRMNERVISQFLVCEDAALGGLKRLIYRTCRNNIGSVGSRYYFDTFCI